MGKKAKDDPSTRMRKKKMIAAMEKALGNVSTASKIAGLTRECHYQWMKDDEDYVTAVNDISEMTTDFVESKLHQLINGGDVASTIFFLKTKAKNRGYVERSEYDVRNVPTIHIVDGSGSKQRGE